MADETYFQGVLVESTPVPLADLKAAKIAALADRRWRAEVAGFVWQRTGTEEYYFIATDRESSQDKLDSERSAAQDGLRRPGDVWKCGDPQTGQAVSIAFTDSEILDMTAAARNRTSDCFNHEADLTILIKAAEDETALAAIDIEAGWP